MVMTHCEQTGADGTRKLARHSDQERREHSHAFAIQDGDWSCQGHVCLPILLKIVLNINHSTSSSCSQFIHSKKIIHRDLKTHNLLVNDLWDTKVADFGISTVNPTATRRMTCIGTPVYMAPEVLQLEAYSTRADVYSFAIVLCELFTNQAPYSEPPYDVMNSPQLVFHIIEKGARPSLEGLHPTLQHLIEECWQPTPHSRPRFPEIILRLERLQEDLVGHSNSPSIEMHSPNLQ